MSPSTVNVERSGNIHLPPGGRKIKSLPGATTTSDWAGLADLLPPDERLGLPARQEVARIPSSSPRVRTRRTRGEEPSAAPVIDCN